MIYVFGDSLTYGWNFLKSGKASIREQLVYPYLLGKKLNEVVLNLSVPGNNNWNIARNIQKYNFTENDYVVIAWTDIMRLELGCSANQLLGKTDKLKIVESSNIITLENFIEDGDGLSFIEKEKKFYVRRISARFLQSPSLWECQDKDFYNFVKQLYFNYISEEYMEEMFTVMFTSVLHKLQNSKCKFVMFNSFSPVSKNNNELLNIPEYIAGYKSHMNYLIRNNDLIKYWAEEEHTKVSEILYDYFTGNKLKL